MTEDTVNRRIEEFIKRTYRLLPHNFETEDLLDDLRTHIHDSLKDKLEEKPDVNPVALLDEVLDEIGTPEDIAEEYRSEQVAEPESMNKTDRWIRYAMRLTAAILVAVLAAWMVSIITEGAVDFTFTVVVLIVFAFIEWWVRGKQTKSA